MYNKEELSQEILETIKDALREELWKEQVKANPLLQMLEAESVYIEEKKKLDSPPIEGALECVTKAHLKFSGSHKTPILTKEEIHDNPELIEDGGTNEEP